MNPGEIQILDIFQKMLVNKRPVVCILTWSVEIFVKWVNGVLLVNHGHPWQCQRGLELDGELAAASEATVMQLLIFPTQLSLFHMQIYPWTRF